MTGAILIVGFFVTALLYASIGFGGGSTYNALLALSGLDYRLLPILALCCNIIVVAGSSWRFGRAGLTPWRRAGLLIAIAAPAAFLGGLMPIGARSFYLLLGASLVLTAIFLLLPERTRENRSRARYSKWMPYAAAPLGYLAGLVGIGGGIFLAPLLHLTNWDGARRIAATAALFILVNSLFGLAGQLLKNGAAILPQAVAVGLPLMLAVAMGGQIGSLLAIRWLPQRIMRWLTAGLTLFVGIRLFFVT